MFMKRWRLRWSDIPHKYQHSVKVGLKILREACSKSDNKDGVKAANAALQFLFEDEDV